LTRRFRNHAQKLFGEKKGFLTFSLTVDNETIKLDKDDYWVAKGCHLIIFYVRIGIQRKHTESMKEIKL